MQALLEMRCGSELPLAAGRVHDTSPPPTLSRTRSSLQAARLPRRFLSRMARFRRSRVPKKQSNRVPTVGGAQTRHASVFCTSAVAGAAASAAEAAAKLCAIYQRAAAVAAPDDEAPEPVDGDKYSAAPQQPPAAAFLSGHTPPPYTGIGPRRSRSASGARSRCCRCSRQTRSPSCLRRWRGRGSAATRRASTCGCTA